MISEQKLSLSNLTLTHNYYFLKNALEAVKFLDRIFIRIKFKQKRKYSLLGGNNLSEMIWLRHNPTSEAFQTQSLPTSVERNCSSSIIKLMNLSIKNSRCLHTHYLPLYFTVTIHTLNLVR